MHRAIAVIVWLGASALVIAQQCTAWSLDAAAPPPGFTSFDPPSINAISDPAHSQTLLVRAARPEGVQTMETWSWNGAAWTLAATGGPEFRYDIKLAYNGANAILTGGHNPFSGANYDDVWMWTGAAWLRVMNNSAHPSGASNNVAYDTVRRRLVKPTPYDVSEWALGMTEWEARPKGTPSPSYAVNVCWDPINRATLAVEITSLYGPMRTWLWNGTAWTLAASEGPSYRAWSQMLVDPTTGHVLFHGGSADSGRTYLDDTWEWNGSSWTRVSSGDNLPRIGPVAFDPQRQEIFTLAAGDAGRWTWGASVPSPEFLTQPQSQSVRAGATVVFSVEVQGGANRHYTWRRNGEELYQYSNVHGQFTPQLTITDVLPGDNAVYDVLVDLPCGPIISQGAKLNVQYCTADFNHDTDVDSDDAYSFFNAWKAGLPAADINGSGGTPDDADVSAFFIHYSAGC